MQQTPAEFRKDGEIGVKMREDICGKKVECFRAPGFSIRESEDWAFEILAELGIQYDCSVFPAAHGHGGMPSCGRAVPSIISHNGVEIKEFPVCLKKIAGKHIVFSGGGYFRFFPYFLIKKWSEDNEEYLLSYIHPRDLDFGQPVLHGLTLKRKFKSYFGLRGAETKLRKWLADFDFTDIHTAAETIEWDKVPIIRL